MMRRITEWFYGWMAFRALRRAQGIAAAQLAEDLGLPAGQISPILARASTDVRKLSRDQDPSPILNRAVAEIKQLGPRSFATEEVQRHLRRLPARDFEIFDQARQGKKHCEIANELGIDVEAVRESLARTYADLRLATMPIEEPEQRRERA